MNQENEQRYREEFEKLEVLYKPHPMEGTRDYFAKNDDGEYRWSHIREDWKIYLAGRKKGEEEIEKLRMEEAINREARILMIEEDEQNIKAFKKKSPS